MTEERPSIANIAKYWQLIFALFLGLVAYLKTSLQVDVLTKQSEARASLQDDRNRSRTSEMESVRTRITILETMMKHGRKGQD